MRGSQIATIARFTLLEALCTRLLWQFSLVVVLILGAAYFMQQIAIAESLRMQIAFAAGATRLAAVFTLSLHILTSMVREFNDKGLELTLSFALRRSDYVFGRLAGHLAIAVMLTVIAVMPLLALSPLQAAGAWALSLLLELAIMSTLSLFCIMTFTQLLPAAGFVCGFYLLARSITAIRLMKETPITGGDTWSHAMIGWLVDGFGLFLPDLDRYTQTTWLVDGAAAGSMLGSNGIQAAIYVLLLGAASMFDFYRRNL